MIVSIRVLFTALTFLCLQNPLHDFTNTTQRIWLAETWCARVLQKLPCAATERIGAEENHAPQKLRVAAFDLPV